MSSFANNGQTNGARANGARPRATSNTSAAANGKPKKKKRRKNKKQQQQRTTSSSNSTGESKVESRTTSTTLNALSNSPFSSLAITPELKRAMSDVFKYQNMTKVQAQAIPVCLTGTDILAKAKTGTGKTIAFLIPAIHKLQTTTTASSRQGTVSILVISPTRELASQIESEAKGLTTFLSNISVQCVYGGTNVKKDLSTFRSLNYPDILIATPGRLNDHLENHGLNRGCSKLATLIFDEADQLLEMGFRPAITKMLNMLPPKDSRQTTLFSATMPNDVMGIARFALRTKFEYVDCVGKDDQGTHQRVPQFVTVYNPNIQFEEIAEVLTEGMREPDFKIIIFFVTARLTGLHAELFDKMGFPVVEIHSRKSQSARTKASKRFRDNKSCILFTSDVSARGMDYPDISMVCQVGLPDTKAQYVHRLGRTARAGKTGIGVLMLAQYERFFVDKECRDQPMKQRPQVTGQTSSWTAKINQALTKLPSKTITTAYQAWLGFYNGKQKKLGWRPEELVRNANAFAMNNCKLSESPALMARTVGKMGLRGTKGLRVEGRNGVPRSEPTNGGGGRGGGGRGGNQQRNNNNQQRNNNNQGQMQQRQPSQLNWQQQQMMGGVGNGSSNNDPRAAQRGQGQQRGSAFPRNNQQSRGNQGNNGGRR